MSHAVVASQEEQKAQRERDCFTAFLKSFGHSVEAARFESRKPPEPDIVYYAKTETIAFELVEICDPNMARMGAALAKTGGVQSVWTSDPTLGVIEQKFSKTYQTDWPLELLCYFNDRLIPPDDQVCDQILEIANRSELKFRRIWYCGAARHCVYNPQNLAEL